MKANIATQPSGTSVVRPLKELSPLIKVDLKNGDTGYIAAGAKLVEARQNYLPHNALSKETGLPRKNLLKPEADRFFNWACNEFDRSPTQIRVYMQMALGTKKTPGAGGGRGEKTRRAGNTWDDIWEDILDGVDFASLGAAAEAGIAAKRKEQNAVSEMMHLIIKTGYHALAMKLHTDLGQGDHDAMVRLNLANEQLKERLT